MRLALIGDIHGHWHPEDVAWIDGLRYDGVLLTGDLPGRSHRDLLDVARRIAPLRTPAVMIPGNHDGPSPLDILREALGRGIDAVGGRRMAALVAALDDALGPVTLGGYSAHPFGDGPDAVDVIVARPHAMDDRKLTFAPYLRERFGVHDLDASATRLRSLVDQCSRPIVFLAHNGPAGFGAHRTDPWGLHGFGRDNGDLDLAAAIAHAADTGKPVAAVVTGHMHWNPRKPRIWQQRHRGVLYVNAARVPRVRAGTRFHLALEVRDGVASAHPMTLTAGA